ncbi:NACHT domain-containing protein [Streptomyces sp. NPDC058122]|uniref:NACHT domain-containing protein n=1 Tax=Streptomyces sp. NPDC058122 TaxID=3346349 RepID=UPI0036E91ADC
MDAVRLLGGTGPVASAVEQAVSGGASLAAGVAPSLLLDLLGADARIAAFSKSLVSGLAERIGGLSRFQRTQRLAAAHSVIAIAAYTEALSEQGFPFAIKDLALNRRDTARLIADSPSGENDLAAVTDHLLAADVPAPSQHQPYEETLRSLKDFYDDAGQRMGTFLAGLAVWDTLDADDRQRTTALLAALPDKAVERYEELYRRLAVEFPEVAFWTDRVDHRATREHLRNLTDAVARLGEGAFPSSRLRSLRRTAVAELDRPVLGEADAIDGMTIPRVGDSYISPDFRLRPVSGNSDLTDEHTWKFHDARTGLDAFLAGYLSSPEAVTAPILVMGQPGAGKSTLTTVLAARLPAPDFLPVRVPLRGVPADADVQAQIEAALLQTIGEHVSWPDVVRAADGALPVVLLDGFDELLQATATRQSDYLRQVAEFQQREALCDRPVAVVVTTRTAVADRATLPPRGIALRLEPFTPAQTTRWLDVWNGHNQSYFTHNGLMPLSPEHALGLPELASQPLLLMMLALYDGEGNALRRERDHLGGYELYERLLSRFARRQVLKRPVDLGEHGLRQAVEEELLRLSVTALAMVNRGQTWVTKDELDKDLAALLPPRPDVTDPGMREALTPSEVTLGRFFFIHRADAQRDGQTLHAYEFLHASFGEFLCARLLLGELRDLQAAFMAGTGRPDEMHPDDDLLHALLSFRQLAGQRHVLDFVEQGLRHETPGIEGDLVPLLKGLFHTALDARPSGAYANYRPSPRTAPARHALYASNLLLLIHASGFGPSARDLFREAADPVLAWRDAALLFTSQFTPEEWAAFAAMIGVQRVWHDGRRDVLIRRWGPAGGWIPRDDTTADPRQRGVVYELDPFWTNGWPPGDDNRAFIGWRHRLPDLLEHESYLLCDQATDMLLSTAQALYEAGVGESVPSYGRLPDDSAESAARALLRTFTAGDDFTDAHRAALWIALNSLNPSAPEFTHPYLDLVARQWRLAGHPLPAGWLERAHAAIDADAQNNTENGIGRALYDEAVAALGDTAGRPAPGTPSP